jgi:hypothetical protein
MMPQKFRLTSRILSAGRSQRFRHHVAAAASVADCRAILLAAPADLTLLPFGAYEISDYLETRDASDRSIYMVSNPLVYWLRGAYPPTRLATLPSNIVIPELITAIEGPNSSPESEMRKIIEKRPNIIVTPQFVWYLRDQPDVMRLLQDALAYDYSLEAVIEGQLIFRRKSN